MLYETLQHKQVPRGQQRISGGYKDAGTPDSPTQSHGEL